MKELMILFIAGILSNDGYASNNKDEIDLESGISYPNPNHTNLRSSGEDWMHPSHPSRFGDGINFLKSPLRRIKSQPTPSSLTDVSVENERYSNKNSVAVPLKSDTKNSKDFPSEPH